MILLLDHDDSFVYTLAGYVAAFGEIAEVRRVHGLTMPAVIALAPTAIILSPGPGAPDRFPLSQKIVGNFGPKLPILGVCLGHQIIAAAYGATVMRAPRPRHGMTSPVSHDGEGVFHGLPSPLQATRYHSLAVVQETVPDGLAVSAVAADDGVVMGVRHRTLPVEGVQFHPESVLTEHGMAMIGNFLGR
ncbi:MAG: aminodeoxychorismate/anthranilate synthase component II [Gemmatimonadota bacterium]